MRFLVFRVDDIFELSGDFIDGSKFSFYCRIAAFEMNNYLTSIKKLGHMQHRIMAYEILPPRQMGAA